MAWISSLPLIPASHLLLTNLAAEGMFLLLVEFCQKVRLYIHILKNLLHHPDSLPGIFLSRLLWLLSVVAADCESKCLSVSQNQSSLAEEGPSCVQCNAQLTWSSFWGCHNNREPSTSFYQLFYIPLCSTSVDHNCNPSFNLDSSMVSFFPLLTYCNGVLFLRLDPIWGLISPSPLYLSPAVSLQTRCVWHCYLCVTAWNVFVQLLCRLKYVYEYAFDE